MYSHFMSCLRFLSPNLQWINHTCCLSYTDNTMPADALATLWARASSGMVLTPKPKYSIASIRRIYQSHRYGRPQAAFCEPAGSYDKTTRTAICFKHKTQYLLIRAPYTRIVVFWHISNIPPMISQSQINCNTPTFYIAAIYCYTTGSWLL